MEFGKTDDISNIDFQLPPDPAGTIRLLQQQPPALYPPRIYIGCTAWSMKEWIGKYYPAKTKSKDMLYHYGQQFSTIELNTTHYRIPDAETIAQWKFNVPEDFRFCPKVLQRISHSRALGAGAALVHQFCDAIAGLEEKLGCCFLQLPPYFSFEQIAELERFIAKFPSSIPLAIEFRHESWFEHDHFENTALLLTQFNIGTVITDVAGRRDVLHLRLTTDTAMIRFVGNDLHPSDFSRIDAWVERLQKWINCGLQNVYFFVHEPDNLLAPDLVIYLQKALEEAFNIEIRGPRLLSAQQLPRQGSLFKFE